MWKKCKFYASTQNQKVFLPNLSTLLRLYSKPCFVTSCQRKYLTLVFMWSLIAFFLCKGSDREIWPMTWSTSYDSLAQADQNLQCFFYMTGSHRIEKALARTAWSYRLASVFVQRTSECTCLFAVVRIVYFCSFDTVCHFFQSWHCFRTLWYGLQWNLFLRA